MKIFFFYVLSLTIVSNTFAQFKGGPKETAFSLGPKAGVNVSNFYGDTSMNNNLYKIDFHGGLLLNFAFNDNLSVQTEFVYSPKGAKFKFHTDSSDFNAIYAIKYLDVPLLFQFKSADVGTAIFIQTGIQYSFLLNAKYSEESTIGSNSSTFSNSNVDSLGLPNKDFGVVLSLGFLTEYGGSFTLRGSLGLNDIWAKNKKLVNYNVVFQASIGYAFGRKYDVIGGKNRW